MYIAMNRFKIVKGKEGFFEDIWKKRDSNLNNTTGFINFHLIKGISNTEFTLYASHSTWESEENFKDWTKSDSFKKAHKNAGKHKNIYVDHPIFEGFKVII